MAVLSELKKRVYDYWNAQSCGEQYAISIDNGLNLEKQAQERYALEPYIYDFARYAETDNKDILELGVGMGADHELWARSASNRLCGVDLTARAVDFTRQRLRRHGLKSNLCQADAEALPFDNDSFDLVYSWGVLHHSPDTPQCIAEVARVLRPGGIARIMIYHKWSLVGLMLWARYGLLAGTPLRSIEEIYFHHLESPGTAYSVVGARRIFRSAGFARVGIRVQLSHGDLLQGKVGARHRGVLLSIAVALWPRALLRLVAARLGLYLLIDARK